MNGREPIVKTVVASVIVLILKDKYQESLRYKSVNFIFLEEESVMNVVLVERFVINANTNNRIK